jgi:hypothetical protein
MAEQTFTSGQILTAAQMTTLQANTGLAYISTTTFSGGSTAQFQSIFTSAYTNYRAVISISSAAGNACYLRFLVGATVQTGNILSLAIGASTSGGTAVTASNRSDQYALVPSVYPTYATTYSMDIFAPQTVSYTSFNLQTAITGISVSDAAWWSGGGRNIATTQIDGFEFTTAGATNIAGTMTLYGYRKA